MPDVITVGLDLAKNVFQVHGADGLGETVLRKKLRRAQVLAFFQGLPPCVVAMEACGGARHCGREMSKFGHDIRLSLQATSNFSSNDRRTTRLMLRRSVKQHSTRRCDLFL